jgi:hypothetical protein
MIKYVWTYYFIFNRSNCIHWQIRNIYFSSALCKLSIISMIKGEISINANNLTLEQKIGQMLISGFPSTEVDDHFDYIVEKLHIGNIILFARNIKDHKQLHILNMTIHKKVLDKLLQAKKEVIHVALRNPSMMLLIQKKQEQLYAAMNIRNMPLKVWLMFSKELQLRLGSFLSIWK